MCGRKEQDAERYCVWARRGGGEHVCLFAPAWLISKRIHWKPVTRDSSTKGRGVAGERAVDFSQYPLLYLLDCEYMRMHDAHMSSFLLQYMCLKLSLPFSSLSCSPTKFYSVCAGVNKTIWLSNRDGEGHWCKVNCDVRGETMHAWDKWGVLGSISENLYKFHSSWTLK